jgi:selenocysteine-specific elongation factor
MNTPYNRHVVLGMAGHIDHGKTEIVKALTGTDTDRLKEEKERGMTTDLGFAFLGRDITIIDVPGHERFVKTMVAGVNTVNLALLVVAADDGVMPQTVEHLEILNLLRVPSGLVAVSKTDLVEKDWLNLVTEDIKTLIMGTCLESAPIIPVSPVTGEGMDTLKQSILSMAEEAAERRDKGVFRLPIDRVFTIKGFGTVVAGTVLSGKVAPEDVVELLPQGISLRVRGVQVHDRPVDQSSVGFRTAINLIGVEKETIQRGNVLAEPGYFRPTQMIDAHFSALKTCPRSLKNRTRVRVHIGTSETISRMVLLNKQTLNPGEEGFVQFHFERPVAADSGDRFVVRSFSPVRTIGGGVILEPQPLKQKRFDQNAIRVLETLLRGDPNQVVLEHLGRCRFHSITLEDLGKSLGITQQELIPRLEALRSKDLALPLGKNRWIAQKNLDLLTEKIHHALEHFHKQNPLKLGMSRASLRSAIRDPVDGPVFEKALSVLEHDKRIVDNESLVRQASHRPRLSPEMEILRDRVEAKLLKDPFNPPRTKVLVEEMGREAEKVLIYLVETGRAVRLADDLVFHHRAMDDAVKTIRRFLTKHGEATVSDLKQALGTTRKFAVPLLVYLDNKGITERDGDLRRLRETGN